MQLGRFLADAAVTFPTCRRALVRGAGAWDAFSAGLLVTGILVRLALALVNTYSNDNHLEISRALAFEGRIPSKEEMEEAFQPKLYHGTVAAIWRLMPGASDDVLTTVAHLVSCAAGILTLALVARFLRNTVRQADTRLVALALTAMNPGLVAINAQATNDSFVILFGTVALWFGWRFFARWRLRDYVAFAVATFLAVLSKGNGLVLIPAVMITFAVSFFSPARRREPATVPRRTLARYAVVFPLVVGAAAWALGPYREHYLRYGTPFVVNREPPPFPRLFEKTYVRRPGITSVVDGLLTFRYVDLLRHPHNTEGRRVYPRHRTSLWTQLYGRAHSIHFDAWPRDWIATRPIVLDLTRAIFVLALLPTALLLAGTVATAVRGVRQLVAPRSEARMHLGRVLLTIAALGYVGFVATYSVQYRDFAVMKAIFLFPGLLGFVLLFCIGCEALYTWCAAHPRWRRLVNTTFVLLLLCYGAEAGLLLLRLVRLRFLS